VWLQLKHENILPFIGLDVRNQPVRVVAKWMENGDLAQYIAGESRRKFNPPHERDLLVSICYFVGYIDRE
jgi:hypothetical protein